MLEVGRLRRARGRPRPACARASSSSAARTATRRCSTTCAGRACSTSPRQYHGTPAHTEHVATLALQMFDDARDRRLHDGDPAERELLWAAAMLHDIGVADRLRRPPQALALPDPQRRAARLQPARGGADRARWPAITARATPCIGDLEPLTRDGDEELLDRWLGAAAPGRAARARPRPAGPRARGGWPPRTASCASTSSPTAIPVALAPGRRPARARPLRARVRADAGDRQKLGLSPGSPWRRSARSARRAARPRSARRPRRSPRSRCRRPIRRSRSGSAWAPRARRAARGTPHSSSHPNSSWLPGLSRIALAGIGQLPLWWSRPCRSTRASRLGTTSPSIVSKPLSRSAIVAPHAGAV